MTELSGEVPKEVLRFPVFTQLENWDMTLPRVRKPTRLFPLTPMGIGTPLVEGLASYLASLAAEHSISVRNLIRDELLPLAASARLNSKVEVKKLGSWKRMNGMADITGEMMSALEIATGLKSFRYMSMLQFTGLISPDVSSAQRRWCSYCLEEFQSKGRVFEPLLWSLTTVLACPFHGCELTETCANAKCSRTSMPLQSHLRAGYCPHCGAWLGSDSFGKVGEEKVGDGLRAAAILTGELLACLPSIPRFNDDIVRRNLKRLTELTVDGNQTAFFRACGLPVQDHFSRYPPTLKALASIARRLEIPMTAFFRPESEHLDAIWKGTVRRMDATILGSMRASNKKLRLLQAVEAWPPISLDSVAQGLGYSSAIPLYRTHRELATRIRMRYSEWSRTVSNTDQSTPNIEDETVRAALQAALLEDEPPPVTDIAKSLGFFESRSFGYYYPDLCEAIVGKREQFRESQLNRMEMMIVSALDENPVPSLNQLSKRLGLKYFNMITDRFPELSAVLIQKRKEQRSERIQAIREILEDLLRRPSLKWDEVVKATGLARGSFAKLYPDLAKRISAKVKETTEVKRLDLFEIAKNNIRETVEELEGRGAQPSIAMVWNAIPRLPYHGKTMVERILRILRPNLVN